MIRRADLVLLDAAASLAESCEPRMRAAHMAEPLRELRARLALAVKQRETGAGGTIGCEDDPDDIGAEIGRERAELAEDAES
jgi:hypothetical protein